MKKTCRYVGPTVGDLANGRPLAPGDVVKGVDLDDPHNRRLLDEGRLIVIETTARTSKRRGAKNQEDAS